MAVIMFVSCSRGQNSQNQQGQGGEAVETASSQPQYKPLSENSSGPTVVFETNYGEIELKLYPDIAPKACENFVGLINQGYYNGITFHRVISGFMIQGGDPEGTGMGGNSIWGGPFPDEFQSGVKFDRPGILAMANAGPNSNKSQFFITLAATPHLNGKHTIFGEVISGYDIVQKLGSAEVGPNHKPKEAQVINLAYTY
jgi:peptidylprolyl isomerase